MSRARKIGGYWFDVHRNGQPATDEQIELLATAEELDLDDLLDSNLSQGEVVQRLRDALGENGIPDDVLKRREEWREHRHTLPECRICGVVGDSTKHHFVNKWILKELPYYAQRWADRTKNTIPVCIHCHRELHKRDEVFSIVEYLSVEEKDFTQRAIQALADERPKLLILVATGDDTIYESRLMKDWIEGHFRPFETPPVTPARLLEQAS